jgi:hypothetical protein
MRLTISARSYCRCVYSFLGMFFRAEWSSMIWLIVRKGAMFSNVVISLFLFGYVRRSSMAWARFWEISYGQFGHCGSGDSPLMYRSSLSWLALERNRNIRRASVQFAASLM